MKTYDEKRNRARKKRISAGRRAPAPKKRKSWKPNKVAARKPKKAVARKPKKAAARKPKKAAARKPKKAAARKPKKAATRKPKKAATRKPKKAAARKPARKPTKPKVSSVVAAQQKARGRTKESRAKRQARSERRAFEKARLEQAIAEQKLPTTTPAERKASRRSIRTGMIADFRRLLKHAKDTNQLSKPERSGPYESHENIGDRRYLRINKVLEPSTVETIMYEARRAAFQLPGRYKRWWTRLDIAGMGEGLFASGQRMLDTRELSEPGRYAEFFQTQAFDSTGLYNTREGMLIKLEEMLEKYAATPQTVVYLRGLSVRNFEGKVRRSRP